MLYYVMFCIVKLISARTDIIDQEFTIFVTINRNADYLNFEPTIVAHLLNEIV